MKNQLPVAVLGAFFIASVIAINSNNVPGGSCLNVASKQDDRVQKELSSYQYSFNQINPCNGQIEMSTYRQGPDWSHRYERYEFEDGTVMGGVFQGYMGGKVTRYTICADGRARVYGASFGKFGYGATQEVCNTL